MREYILSEEGEPEKNDDSKGLSDALLQLEQVSLSLRTTGRAIFGFTIGNLAFAVLSLLSGSAPDGDLHWSGLIGAIISGLGALALAVMGESWRKRGDALFEEISDELQWNIRGTRLLKDKSPAKERPEIQARVVLRTFARASDLPIIPGKFGPAIYITVNLLITFLAIFLPRVLKF